MNKERFEARLKMSLKVFLVLCFLVYFNTSNLLAENITEGSDWATEAMIRWQDRNVLNGTSSGVLAPGEKIAKKEAVTILNRVNNVEIASVPDESKFKDIETFRWYYNEFDKAVATGLIEGDSNGNMNPNDYLSREIGFSMIARLFNISYSGSDAKAYLEENFKDASDISESYEMQIAGLLELGYIDGYDDGTIKPKEDMTRGEFITLLDNLISLLINVKGDYDMSNIYGTVVINVTSVSLSNVSDDLVIYLTAGSNGEVTISEDEHPTIIEVGTVESNRDYSAYKASERELIRKKIVTYNIVHNMPTCDDLPESLMSWYGKIKGTDEWNELIFKVSKEEEVDPVFVKCIMAIESSGNPLAIGHNTNGTTDYGLMQVNSTWASSFDLDRILDDYEYAIRCGVKVIKRKIAAAESAKTEPTVHEVAWRYNGKSSKGEKYADKFAALYEGLTGISAFETSVRTK